MLLASSTVFAESAVLECTADSWISSREPKQSHGNGDELKVRGKTALALLNFRFTAVPNWKIRKATLLLHKQDLEEMQRIGLAVIPIDWHEGEATFQEAQLGKRWTNNKANVGDLLLKAPNARTAFGSVTEKEMGWVAVDVPAELVNEIVEGRGFGLALFDKSLRSEKTFDARETIRYAPYLLVEGSRH
jgi:hypothetical protein